MVRKETTGMWRQGERLMKITPGGRVTVRSQQFRAFLKHLSFVMKEDGRGENEINLNMIMLIAWVLTGHSFMTFPKETEKEELRLWIAQADSMVSMVDCGWSGDEIAKFFETDSVSVMTTVRKISEDGTPNSARRVSGLRGDE
jgi:hypothetical protein